MKIKLSLALGLLALGLSPALSAWADVETFDQFSVNVPPGWETEFRNGDNTGVGANLFLSKEDQSAMISYSLEALTDGQWEAMIKDMTDNPKPDTGPAQINSADNFLVTFTDNKSGMSGKETYYRVGNDRYIKEVTIGYAPDMMDITNSFQLNSTPPEEPQ